ncbi:MAG: hypothetical protein SFV54_24745 [Bryobacteraceae bacterium]|nr:hypothetical protein [Bryobacteraceae bacterium]
MKRHRGAPITLFVFSSDLWTRHVRLEDVSLGPWPEGAVAPGVRYRPRPGYYVVSINLLTGLLYPREHQDFLAEFRTMQPYARAGYSINIYRVE